MDTDNETIPGLQDFIDKAHDRVFSSSTGAEQHIDDESINSDEESNLLGTDNHARTPEESILPSTSGSGNNQPSRQPDRNSSEQYDEFFQYIIEEVTPKKRELMKRKYDTLKKNGGKQTAA